jgi:hypothetical protein
MLEAFMQVLMWLINEDEAGLFCRPIQTRVCEMFVWS